MWFLFAFFLSVAPAAEPVALADSEGVSTYDQALEAWRWGRFRLAYERAVVAVAEDPGNPAPRLLEGYALSRLGQWEDGVEIVRPLQQDPVVGAHARFWVKRHDGRWRRDQFSLSFSGILRGDRGPSSTLQLGASGGPEFPLVSFLTLRTEIGTRHDTDDEVNLRTVALAVGPAAYLTLRTWSLFAVVAPVAHIGHMEPWTGRRNGVFPGLRVSAGFDARLSRSVALRQQLDYDVAVVANRFFSGTSRGLSGRWTLVYFLPGKSLASSKK